MIEIEQPHTLTCADSSCYRFYGCRSSYRRSAASASPGPASAAGCYLWAINVARDSLGTAAAAAAAATVDASSAAALPTARGP
jgi:hypothetical protein